MNIDIVNGVGAWATKANRDKKIRIKVVISGGMRFAISKSGYAMPLVEFYEFAAREGNNIINPNYFKFWMDIKSPN